MRVRQEELNGLVFSTKAFLLVPSIPHPATTLSLSYKTRTGKILFHCAFI